MTATKITSEVCLVSDVFLSGHFAVPWHQRYFDWKVEQVCELLSDFEDALESERTCYFLGSIMLVKPVGNAPQRINDGQQRLITLSLILAAFCRRFANDHPRDSGREALALRALFDRPDNVISELEDASRFVPRIKPPKNDSSNYSQIIRGHDIGTNGLLSAAWHAINNFVGAMSRVKRVKFFDYLLQKVEVSVLKIPTDVDASSVFEALNARGKPLDDVDLIRNRLYSYFSEADDAERRNTVHGNLEGTVVILRSQRAVQEYFRCFLQCQFGYLRKTRFYREAKIEIEKAAGLRMPSDYVFQLVSSLGRIENIELFRTITSRRPSQSIERHLPRTVGSRSLTTLLGDLQGYKVSHPIVFALLNRFITATDRETKRKAGRTIACSLKNLASFMIRTAFVAPKFEPSRFEAEFANCAHRVFNGNDLRSLDVMEDLEQNDEWKVIGDANFVRRMTEMEISDRKKALRYLFGINAKKQTSSDILREDRCTILHVLPLSDAYWKGWNGFKGVDASAWVYRTGNLVVVSEKESRSNMNCNRNFAAKRLVLGESALQMPRAVAETYDEWTPEVVEKRSRDLAQEAAKAWNFAR